MSDSLQKVRDIKSELQKELNLLWTQYYGPTQTTHWEAESAERIAKRDNVKGIDKWLQKAKIIGQADIYLDQLLREISMNFDYALIHISNAIESVEGTTAFPKDLNIASQHLAHALNLRIKLRDGAEKLRVASQVFKEGIDNDISFEWKDAISEINLKAGAQVGYHLAFIHSEAGKRSEGLTKMIKWAAKTQDTIKDFYDSTARSIKGL